MRIDEIIKNKKKTKKTHMHKFSVQNKAKSKQSVFW